jgi:hypothetical protein
MRPASFQERLLAALIDGAVVILGIAAAIGLGLGAAVAYARIRGEYDEAESDEDDHEDVSPSGSPGDGDVDGSDEHDDGPRGVHHGAEFLQSRLVRAALQGGGGGLAVAGRNWRSVGFTVVGLRRVDAHTAGPVSVRSALIGAVFNEAQQAVTGPLFRSRARRERDRLGGLRPKLKEIEHQYEADPEARQRAMIEFYEANKINPTGECGWLIARAILTQLILATAIRNGRTAYDRLTGTMVVSNR